MAPGTAILDRKTTVREKLYSGSPREIRKKELSTACAEDLFVLDLFEISHSVILANVRSSPRVNGGTKKYACEAELVTNAKMAD